MELKDAYKQAFKEEIQPLIDAGKMTVLGTVEDLAGDLAEAFVNAAKKGAKLSASKWDDVVVPPAADYLLSLLMPQIDKISGQE